MLAVSMVVVVLSHQGWCHLRTVRHHDLQNVGQNLFRRVLEDVGGRGNTVVLQGLTLVDIQGIHNFIGTDFSTITDIIGGFE